MTNGGSSAALLAFLQAIWGPDTGNLFQFVIVALGLLATSLPLIAWAQYNEAQISLAYEEWFATVLLGAATSPAIRVSKPRNIKRLKSLRVWLVRISTGLCCVALGVVCMGAWLNVPA